MHLVVSRDKTTQRSHQEIKPLTGVRGVAAFVVMVYHLHFAPQLAGFFPVFLHRGYLSVDLFFILSGFILAVRYSAVLATELSATTLGTFWRHRFARIYPAYFVISAFEYLKSLVPQVIVVTHTVVFSPFDILANIFLLQTWGIGAVAISVNSWSISTEVFAYVIFPIVVLVLAKARSAAIPIFVAAVSIAGITAVAASHHDAAAPLNVTNGTTSFLPLLRCLAGFCLGVSAFKLARHPLCCRLLARESSLAIVLLGMACVLYLGYADVLVASIMALLIICLFYRRRLSELLFGNRLVHYLGVISYSLYLVHPLCRGFAASLQMKAHAHGLSLPSGAFVLLAVALSWGTASLSQRFIEEKGRRLLDRLLSKGDDRRNRVLRPSETVLNAAGD